MNASVKKLEGSGLIEKIDIGFDQVFKNLKRSKKEVKIAAAALSLDAEVAFNCAYNAMLHAGRALMFSYNYRPKDGQQHLTVVEFCEVILGPDLKNLIIRYNKARQKRNTGIRLHLTLDGAQSWPAALRL